MPRILITHDIMPQAETHLASLSFTVVRRAIRDQLCRPEELSSFDGVLSMGTRYPAETIQANKQLRIIALGSAGFDSVDIAAAKAQGVAVTNAPGANALAVAEHTAMLILACAKDLSFAGRCIRSNDWRERLAHYTVSLAGKTLAIIGAGSIGREVARIMHDGFGMRILAYRRPGSQSVLPAYIKTTDSLDMLYAASDVVSVHVPLTRDTLGMIDASAFRKMKRTAIFINCARGKVVCQQALTEALQNGTIAFAGLDVLEAEPPRADDPLLSLDNVIITPHNAAITRETTQHVCMIAAENIAALFAGKPVLNSVY